jgi:hypothetical protein
MDFGPFGPLLLIYLLLGVRVLWQMANNWHATWDETFTAADRSLVTQAAFFVLIPVSVALHELGHAVAVKAFGGTILSWGYYGFAGFVGYDPRGISPVGQMVITAAGTLVNILIAAIALWLVFARKPPMRAAFNELLVQFVIISLLNALVLYPLIDFATDMNGDWQQMYFGGVLWFSILVIVVQAAILGGLWWAWRNPAIQRRIAELTGRPAVIPVRQRRSAPPGERRMPAPGRPATPDATLSETERLLHGAAERVAAGWPDRLEAGVHPTPDGALLALQWGDGDLQRAVIARAAGQTLEVSGAVAAPGEPPARQLLGRYDTMPDADRLTIDLRVAMEQVAGWTPAPAPAD